MGHMNRPHGHRAGDKEEEWVWMGQMDDTQYTYFPSFLPLAIFKALTLLLGIETQTAEPLTFAPTQPSCPDHL